MARPRSARQAGARRQRARRRPRAVVLRRRRRARRAADRRTPATCGGRRRAARSRTAARRSRDQHSSSVPGKPARSARRRVEREQAAVVEQRDARQRSASSRYGVDIRMVMPPSQEAATAASRTRAATPGRRRSSARRAAMSSGSWTSVQASASFCFMPPDSRSARRVAERRELRHVEQPVAARRVVGHAVDLGEERDVLVDAQVAVEAEALRQVADLGGRARGAASPDRGRARGSCRRRRAAGRTAGGCAVVLPAPSGPMSPNISPRRDVERQAVDGGRRAVTLGAPTRSKRQHGGRSWRLMAAPAAGRSASTGMPCLRTPSLLSTVMRTR